MNRNQRKILRIEEALYGPDGPFALEDSVVLGERIKVFANRASSLRALIEASSFFGEKEYIIYEDRRVTYAEHLRAVASVAKALQDKYGIGKGDRVYLFLPRIPELYIAMVGCAKIGAIIAPLYINYRESAVKERMLDGQGKVLITTAQYLTRVPTDELPDLEHIIITGEKTPDAGQGDVSWDAEMAKASEDLAIEWVDKEFPLFLI